MEDFDNCDIDEEYNNIVFSEAADSEVPNSDLAHQDDLFFSALAIGPSRKSCTTRFEPAHRY